MIETLIYKFAASEGKGVKPDFYLFDYNKSFLVFLSSEGHP